MATIPLSNLGLKTIEPLYNGHQNRILRKGNFPGDSRKFKDKNRPLAQPSKGPFKKKS